MKKIVTLFERNEADRKHVTDRPAAGTEWVFEGKGLATRKFDGTCVMCDPDNAWWARREVKAGKTAPGGFRQEQVDDVTGKTVGWEPIRQSSFIKPFLEAHDGGPWPEGTYELCGPKINGNPEHLDSHVLVPHGEWILASNPSDPAALIEECRLNDFEGIVWWATDGTGCKAKLKVRDYA